MHYRRPDFEVRGEDVEIFDPREREPIKLSMQHQPFCITFGYYEDGSIMLLTRRFWRSSAGRAKSLSA
jgi:exosome complex component RRP45